MKSYCLYCKILMKDVPAKYFLENRTDEGLVENCYLCEPCLTKVTFEIMSQRFRTLITFWKENKVVIE